MIRKYRVKNKIVWINVASSFKEMEEFDIKFWRSVGAQGRFSATWLMLRDYMKVKGEHGDIPRLRRSVQNIQHL